MSISKLKLRYIIYQWAVNYIIMWKIKVFLKRIASGSFKRFFNNLEIVHKESGKNRVILFIDMVISMFVYGIGYLDYLTFGFAYIGHKKRKTFLTMNDNVDMCKRLNDPSVRHIFVNKRNFYSTFNNYLKRDYVDLANGFEEFEKFCKGKSCFFAKGLESFGGLEVQKVDIDGATDLKELFDKLYNKGMFLAEEAIVQHEKMAYLCDRSVNTIRIVTVISEKGEPRFVYALVRVGSGKNDVDNITSGGMYTLLSHEGVITHPLFCDKTVTYYTEHPVSGNEFIGTQMPFFKEAVDLCLEAALVVPNMRYVGWDVSVTADGPLLVEGNDLPGYDMCQNHVFHDDGCGLKAAFENALNG